MLCYHSSNEDWPLLNHISAALQGTEDVAHDALSLGLWSAAWVSAASHRTVTVESVKHFWSKAKSLSKCLELQLEHLREYQLFYQTLTDYEGSLEMSFATIRDRLQQMDTAGSGSNEEARAILDSTQMLITHVLLWWRRTDVLVAQSRRVLPMRARMEPTDFKRPGHLLVEYATPETTLRANDDVFIVDSTNRDQWIVETASGERIAVPSLCLAMSGPDPGAIERALALRLQLLANWTIALKELGKSLISYMLAIFRRLNDNQVESLNEVRPAAQGEADMQPLLGTMEQLLQSYWSDHPDFEELRERMRKARLSLAVFGAEDHIDDCTHIDINTIFLRMCPLVMESNDAGAKGDDAIMMKQIFGLLIRKYQGLAKYWEAYKLMTEASTDPNYFWMMEEFQQLRRVNLSELLEFMSHEDKDSWVDVLQLLAARKSMTDPAAAGASPLAARYRTEVTMDVVDSGIGMARSASSPSQVIDLLRRESNGEETRQPKVKVRERVAAYENKVASAAASSDDAFLPADEELGQLPGLSRRTVARRGSTASSVRSSRYSVRSTSTAVGRSTEIEDYKREEIERKSKLVISCVVDTQDKTVLSLEAAVRKGILNWKTGSYFNREANDWIPIQAALSKGLIIAESRTEGRAKVKKRRVYGMVTMRGGDGGTPLIVTAVHDLSSGVRLEPAVAQARGLANQTLTQFLDTRANEWIDTDEACNREVIEFDLPIDTDESPTECFMIYSALDVANGQALSFQQAKERGVIDADEGVFWNSETGEALELDVAIRKGFVRANRVVANRAAPVGGSGSQESGARFEETQDA